MSLFEQTITRLKKEKAQAGGAEPGAPHTGASDHHIDPHLEMSNSANRISIDCEVLRAAGYWPEAAKEKQFANQFRRIKRPLIDKAHAGKSASGDPRIIMVTSALAGDGKTFTSVNLALSMSMEHDMSVLLIDADVAKRHVSEILGLGAKPGLMDVLAQEKTEPHSVVIPTTTRGLSILPAGAHVPNTSELLSSSRMGKLMASLSAANPRRILLLDSPPLLLTSEATSLLKYVGQVVLVVRARQTPRQALRAALALLDMHKAGGVVLNDVAGGFTDEYYGYGSYGTDGKKS